MAVPLQRSIVARKCLRLSQYKIQCALHQNITRTLSTSLPLRSTRRAGPSVKPVSVRYFGEDDDDIVPEDPMAPLLQRAKFPEDLSEAERKKYDSLPPEGRKEFEQAFHQQAEALNSVNFRADMAFEMERIKAEIQASRSGSVAEKPEQFRPGFLAGGEEDEEGTGPDPDYPADGDDVTALAQEQLDMHRDKRHFARLIAWEMPLLYNLRKSFSLPSEDQVLRFRYTTYLGDTHPSERKVVVELCVTDLKDLTAQQREKLIKLAGARYNPETEIIQMGCDNFETQAQNKRYLGDLVDKLLTEAKDSKDKFEDVPFDFRHHTYKPKHIFPDQWLMTPQRRKDLDNARAKNAAAEQKRKLVDGTRIIEQSYLGISAGMPGVRVRAGRESEPVRVRR